MMGPIPQLAFQRPRFIDAGRLPRARRAGTVLAVGTTLSIIAGCSSSSGSGQPSIAGLSSDGIDRAPSRVVPSTTRNDIVRAAAADELGHDVVASMPAEAPAAPQVISQPPDPGAIAIVRSVASAIPNRPVNAQGLTLIRMTDLRNFSRADQTEFADFSQRLADLLTRAGREDHLQFTFGGSVPGTADSAVFHYRLMGSAYLINADGFDQWELFLGIAPVDRSVSVWESVEPIHVLRTPRPGQPQVTSTRLPGRGAP